MNIAERLYPFQTEDVSWMREHLKCLNGDFLGAGKTVEALALVEELDLSHVLVVCPKSLVNSWFWQCEIWLDGDALTPHENSQYEHRLSGLDLSGPRFVVVNYDLLSNPKCWSALHSVKWDMIIFDEAHRLKNHKAKRTRNAYLLAPGVPRILLMTGTPMQNSPADLFPLFHLMNPSRYHNYHWWVNTFCVTEEDEIWLKGQDGKPRPRYIKRIVPGKVNHTVELNQLLHMYMVRREKHDVLKDLPPKVYRTIPVDLGPEKKQYLQMQEEYFALLDNGELISSPKASAQMMRLRQICCDPYLLSTDDDKPSTTTNKTQALLDLLEDTDEKMIVYTYFEQYVRILSRELDSAKVSHVIVTGKEKSSVRTRAEQTFQSDPNVRVMLGTIGALKEGLTLTEAKTVVFMDRWWNPSVNEQCEDRAYGRVNKGLEQTESTLIIDLFNQGTVEEHVHAIITSKEEMTEAVVTAKVVDLMRRYRYNELATKEQPPREGPFAYPGTKTIRRQRPPEL